MSAKKHHYVPQFLLREFASPGEQLRVEPIKRPDSYTNKVLNIGHTNRGHSLYYPGRPADHDTLEIRMSRLEGAASSTIRDIGDRHSRVLSVDEKEVLAFFIALQWSRHRLLLEHVRKSVLDEIPVEPDAPDFEYATKSLGLATILMGVLDPWEARVADSWSDPKDAFSPVASRLLGMNWGLFRSRQDALVVSDNLVCLSGVAKGATHDAPSDVWTNHGIGIGFSNCRRVTIPLTPRLALIVAPDSDDTQGLRAQQINQYTVGNSREFVAYHPDWPARQPKRHAEVRKYMFAQRFIIAGALEHLLPAGK